MKRVLAIALLMMPLVALAYPRPCDHPRLLLHSGEEEAVRAAIATQPILQEADRSLICFCDKLLELPPFERKMAGMRIYNMREVLKRVFDLSYAYRIHGDRRYADRAIEEMLNAVNYVDWNPSHYLDVAEICMGVSIGYDWLYDVMTPAQRKIVAEGIKKHAFETSKKDKYTWFYSAFHNWNQVCNAGLVYGAIALWDEYYDEANRIMDRCFATNYLPLREGYSEDGAYAEGYSYWGYGSGFQIMLIAGLESAFGSDLGLMDNYAKFYRSGRFMQMMNRPTGYCFNYADCGKWATAEHILVWLAAKTGDTSLLYEEIPKLRQYNFSRLDNERLLPFFVIYGKDMDLSSIEKPSINFYTTEGLTPLYIYRSDWDSPDDTYLGIKAGLASSNHGHNDIGSFVFDADGVVWADDLGSQGYLSLESKGVDLWNRLQNSQRYDVYRISPFSHNIITVNGHKPDVYQYTRISRTWCESGRKGAEINLKMPYWEDLKAYMRTITVEGEDDAVLQIKEELQAREDTAKVRWAMCSMADAEIVDASTIRLSKNGHSRLLKIDGYDAKAEIWSAQPATEFDYPNPDNVLAGFTFSLAPEEKATLNVRLIKEK
ncbi:MAG: heparinase II/III family protein [Bacteroidales bacterium]|nr:heparinase II/III family protein [Bacteroidales bacterium]